MCGIAGLFGPGWSQAQLDAMVSYQRHRGPDGQACYGDPQGPAALGHDRLSIIDLSDAGAQPMKSVDGRFVIAFNGEIYNYLELRQELSAYRFRSRTDTEVILAAYERWGEACLDRFIGMFAFLIWDTREQRLFAARDRFGVKPLYYSIRADGSLAIASEIGALRAAGVADRPDPVAWATYLVRGLQDYSERTFWLGVNSLPAGHRLTWSPRSVQKSSWYDLPTAVGEEYDQRGDTEVENEYRGLLEDSVALRFRADVPVGINLSGGVDSCTLLGLVHAIQGPDSDVVAFTFATNDARYDELPWVKRMLDRTRHRLVTCALTPKEVPALAESVHAYQSEPFGGIPTLAYGKIFEQARAEGIIVLLDGQGMDEQWAGYDYYRVTDHSTHDRVIQGTTSAPVRPQCLEEDFAALAEPVEFPRPFSDALRNMQYRDARFTKIPRALRFNDRISMRASTELREPFLDHRLFELAFRQPSRRKIQNETGKYMLRRIARGLVSPDLLEAPKRPVQTPQREWLRGPLSDWAAQMLQAAVDVAGGSWLNRAGVATEWERFRAGEGDNSFFVWQWINLGLATHDWD